MIEYINNNVLCVQGGWLVDQGIMSEANYAKLVKRNRMNRIQRACQGRPALIEYSSIPRRFQMEIKKTLGYDPTSTTRHTEFRKMLTHDSEAVTFFSHYQLQNGQALPIERQKEYYSNAKFLKAIHLYKNNMMARRRAMGGNITGVWDIIADMVADLREEFGHSLPANPHRLRDKMEQYQQEGYTSLIHRGYGNNNSRKVNQMLEKLILSIYIMNNKPYPTMVRDIYLEFLAGKLDIIDKDSGELYDRNEFFSDKGAPIVISDATIWNYVNNPKNRAIVDSERNDFHYYNNIHRPHHHRERPQYSLSKISLDDRDLQGKILHGGKRQRVKAYYAYDVASGCLIGSAYSKMKDKELYLACMRDMFMFLSDHRLGFPLELEVEHHIVSKFNQDLMKAGNVFPHIRWCAPGNSQEKRAEHFNRAKKYGYEKRYNDGVGRFTLSEANRPKQDKTWDDDGMHLKEKIYEFDELVANDRYTIDKYNNGLHPNQKKHKGMTRLQVFLQSVNPYAVKFQDHIVAQYAGERCETSIRRNQYVRVNYADYQLPSADLISRLAPNDYKVEAFYLPKATGAIDSVHIFQDGQYLATCQMIERYNEATAEQTDDDQRHFESQSKYVASFDKMIRKGRNEKTSKLEIVTRDESLEAVPVKLHESATLTTDDDWDDFESIDATDYAKKAFNDL